MSSTKPVLSGCERRMRSWSLGVGHSTTLGDAHYDGEEEKKQTISTVYLITQNAFSVVRQNINKMLHCESFYH